ncbi:MAG: Asp23/Gls24 family envelope stress response protein [Clostridiaceae bacterium]|nr:Asp23/Gls24 family envelope stress response protein [Clostridiaceae bacterium]
MAQEAAADHLQDHQERDKPERGRTLRTLGRLADVVNRQSTTEKADDDMRAVLASITVIAFIGPSGTGKSTHATRIASKYQIAFIIDDGLLIHGSRILAGASAKKAPSKLESVRQALFADETRAAVMRRALAAQKPSTLMILGTSDGMLTKICQNLWLNPPRMLIRIEDVSTEEEMRQAREVRLSQGKHAIPVPSMEIKHEFSVTFIDPFARLRRRRDRSHPAADTDRTVVRPTFSGLGSYSMSDEAIRMMIEIIISQVRGVAGLTGFTVRTEVYGVVLDIDLALFYGYNAPQVLQDVQEKVSSQIEAYTAINVMVVNVRARRVVHQPEPAAEHKSRRLS